MAGIAAARLSTATPATFVGRNTWIPRQRVPAPDKGGGGAGTKPGAGQGLDIPGERSFNRPGGQVAPGRGVFGHRFPAGGSSRPADIAPEPGDRAFPTASHCYSELYPVVLGCWRDSVVARAAFSRSMARS